MKHKLIIAIAFIIGWTLNFGFPVFYAFSIIKNSQTQVEIIYVTPTSKVEYIVATLKPTKTPNPTHTSLPTITQRPTATFIPTVTVSKVNSLAVVTLNPVKTAVKPTTPSYPPDITAICKDGKYSYSKHKAGTCSGHGGVKKWINKPSQ